MARVLDVAAGTPAGATSAPDGACTRHQQRLALIDSTGRVADHEGGRAYTSS